MFAPSKKRVSVLYLKSACVYPTRSSEESLLTTTCLCEFLVLFEDVLDACHELVEPEFLVRR